MFRRRIRFRQPPQDAFGILVPLLAYQGIGKQRVRFGVRAGVLQHCPDLLLGRLVVPLSQKNPRPSETSLLVVRENS